MNTSALHTSYKTGRNIKQLQFVLSDILSPIANSDFLKQQTSDIKGSFGLNNRKELTSLVQAIKGLQSFNKKMDKSFSRLFGRTNTLRSMRRSLLGKFISKEIEQSSLLNVFGGAKGIRSLQKMRLTGSMKGMAILAPVLGLLAGGLATSGITSFFKKFFNFRGGQNQDFPQYEPGIPSGTPFGGTPSGGFQGGGQKSYPDLAKYTDRGSKNINPGNITGSGYLGQVGIDDDGKGHRYAVFATKEAGVAGVVHRLYRYNQDKIPGDDLSGKKTIRDIMETYAPKEDGNDTEGYITDISKALGISDTKPIDFMQNPELLEPFVRTIMRNESPGYRSYSDAEIKKGIEIGVDVKKLGKEEARAKHAAFLEAGQGGGKGASAGGMAGGSPKVRSQQDEGFAQALNTNLWSATQSAHGSLIYDYGAKGTGGSKYIDCSGWITKALTQAGAPQEILDMIRDKTSTQQVIDVGNATKTLQDNVTDLVSAGVKEGMLVGVKNKPGRDLDIGHVGLIVRNPQNGELGVSHASSKRGTIVWDDLSTFQRGQMSTGAKGFVLSDPLAHSENPSGASQPINPPPPPKAEPEPQKPLTPEPIKQPIPEPAKPVVPEPKPMEPLRKPEPQKPTTEPLKAPPNVPDNKPIEPTSAPKQIPVGNKPDSPLKMPQGVPDNRQSESLKVPEPLKGKMQVPSNEPSGSDLEEIRRRMEDLKAELSKKLPLSYPTPSIPPVAQNTPDNRAVPVAQKDNPTVVQPIVVPVADKGKGQKQGPLAGGPLPFQNPSQVVLQYTMDPLSPVYKS